MEEFLKACLSFVNLPYTTAVTVMSLYWLSVIMGVLDWNPLGGVDAHAEIDAPGDLHLDADGALDLHADGDLDLHADSHVELGHGADADLHAHVDAGAPESWLSGFKIFTIGEAPLTVFATIFAVTAWAVSILANHYLHNSSLLVALAFSPGILLGAFITARIASWPFGVVFRSLTKDLEHHEKLVGKTCIITTSQADHGFGQAEIRTKGAPLLLTVRTQEGVTLKAGERALIIRHDKEAHLYIIRPYPYETPEIDHHHP